MVVLPWVPETAIVGLSRVSSASRSARCSSGAPVVRSGLSGAIALEYTTSAPAGTFSAAWPSSDAVRAGDLGAEDAGDLREPAHPDAADADEVEFAS